MDPLSKLDVVNGCLATMGESPLNALDTDHPFVQSALLAMAAAEAIELGRGWWFNTDYPTLVPDPLTGYVYIPADVLDMDTPYTQLVQRGRRIYDRFEGTYDLRDLIATMQGRQLRAKLVRRIPFEDLPALAQHLVATKTWVDFQASFDADVMRYRELTARYSSVLSIMNQQDIRNSNVNMFNSPGVLDKMRRIRPMRTGIRTIRGF